MKASNVTAVYYDLFHNRDHVGDAEFWKQTAANAKGPILEMGCGTGRVTFSLATLGHEITGLDNSEAMLAKARGKLATQLPDVKGKVMLLKGDMADLSLDTRFGLIIIPFHGFQCLLSQESQASCLAAALEHLDENGSFVVDLFNPDLHLMAASEANSRLFETERIDPETSNVILRYVRNRIDHVNQVIHGTYIYETLDPEGKLVSTEFEKYAMRWTWPREMEYLLRLSGFKIDAFYGNYHRVPFPEASKELIFVCSRARA